jgi:hypothetical protein
LEHQAGSAANLIKSIPWPQERYVKKPCLAPAISDIKLPVQDRQKRDIEVDHAVILPHNLLATFHSISEDMFREHIMPTGITQLEEFWNHMSAHPAVANNPMTKTKN